MGIINGKYKGLSQIASGDSDAAAVTTPQLPATPPTLATAWRWPEHCKSESLRLLQNRIFEPQAHRQRNSFWQLYLLWDSALPMTQAMRLRIERAILDAQLWSSASHVISEDSDLYRAFTGLSPREAFSMSRQVVFKSCCGYLAIFSLYPHFIVLAMKVAVNLTTVFDRAKALRTNCLIFVRVQDCYSSVLLPSVLWFALEISICSRKGNLPKSVWSSTFHVIASNQ